MGSETKWTEEQSQVIASRGQTLLVSAAAGSGKTAVLVQRILDQLLDPSHPADVDRMLVVTFTKAAAGQLREKIRRRLEEAAGGEDPKRAEEAVRQLALLSGDHIETIDSFCKEVVADHADLLGIDPAFRIADDGEQKLLQADAAAQVIEEAYASEDPEYARSVQEFSELYAPGKTDRSLEDLILKFYTFSQSHPFPRLWRRECARQYRADAEGSAWKDAMTALTRMKVSELRLLIRQALEICLEPEGPYHYASALQSHERLFGALENCTQPGEFGSILRNRVWDRPGTKKRGKNAPFVDPAKEQNVKDIREGAKKELEKLEGNLFPCGEEEIVRLQEETARYMDVLVSLTDRFEDAFWQMKQERGIADFSDVAHGALRVLIRTDENGYPVTDDRGGYVPTEQAWEYADYFEEIYIDEYQDSNSVQEILLWSISRDAGTGHNRFLVGDVKQSIYRFRMAEPELFVEKAAAWSPDEEAAERRIDLHRNFRSRGCVLDLVNLIFRQIMRREIGGVEYDDTQELKQGFPFPEDTEETCPELILVQKEDVPQARDRIEAEACAVAQRILAMAGRQQVYDKDRQACRPMRFGDIAILLRTSRGWAETFSRVLAEHGIPNRAGANTGYFDAPEVRTLLSYLHVLDNPRQDIPLAASLRSRIGHLNDRELAMVRAFSAEGSLYESVTAYLERGPEEAIREKLKAFTDRVDSLRRRVRDTPVHLLLWQILDETGFAEAVSASEGGRQKKANLDLLVDKAIAFEATSYRGLFHFIRYIEKLRKGSMDFGKAESGSADEDMVHIMTMHASKGLEFPVVFVSGLAKQHNQSDARSQLSLHGRLGAGIDHVDPRLRVRRPNRISSVISQQIMCDSIGEELRVLYVAMTRAEEKLILTGCVNDLEKTLSKMAAKRSWPEEKFAGTDILGASSMLDWVLWGLLRHESTRAFFDRERWNLPAAAPCGAAERPGRIRILTAGDLFLDAEQRKMEEAGRVLTLADVDPDTVYDPELDTWFRRMLTTGYSHAGLEGMPGKLSVSELKHEGYAAEMARLEEMEPAVPMDSVAGGQPEEPGSAAGAGPEPAGTVAGETAAAAGAGPGAGAGEPEVPVPQFLQEQEQKMSGTARGTAVHAVLAALDFTQEPYPGQVAALLETMVKCDRIQKEEAAAVDPAKIEAFQASDLAARMRKAARQGKLLLEQPFVIGRKGDEIREDWSGDETVLIQGIIDAFFLEEDHIVLVDYKTDRARPGDEKSLERRYRTQFELYRDALEMLLDRKVTEGWLYSLSLGRAIAVDLRRAE